MVLGAANTLAPFRIQSAPRDHCRPPYVPFAASYRALCNRCSAGAVGRLVANELGQIARWTAGGFTGGVGLAQCWAAATSSPTDNC